MGQKINIGGPDNPVRTVKSVAAKVGGKVVKIKYAKVMVSGVIKLIKYVFNPRLKAWGKGYPGAYSYSPKTTVKIESGSPTNTPNIDKELAEGTSIEVRAARKTGGSVGGIIYLNGEIKKKVTTPGTSEASVTYSYFMQNKNVEVYLNYEEVYIEENRDPSNCVFVSVNFKSAVFEASISNFNRYTIRRPNTGTGFFLHKNEMFEAVNYGGTIKFGKEIYNDYYEYKFNGKDVNVIVDGEIITIEEV